MLHPEDTESTEEDLTIVTLERLLLRDRYNDLGFMVSNRLVILVEAQSTWSVNILVRFLLYIADTYNRYIEKNGKTRKAVQETLQICRDDNILKDYLRNEEVADIMFTFVDREKQLNMLLAREREQNKAEGFAEGREEGLAVGRSESLTRLKRLYTLMKQDGRLDDYDRAMEDDELFEQYAEEYGI